MTVCFVRLFSPPSQRTPFFPGNGFHSGADHPPSLLFPCVTYLCGMVRSLFNFARFYSLFVRGTRLYPLYVPTVFEHFWRFDRFCLSFDGLNSFLALVRRFPLIFFDSPCHFPSPVSLLTLPSVFDWHSLRPDHARGGCLHIPLNRITPHQSIFLVVVFLRLSPLQTHLPLFPFVFCVSPHSLSHVVSTSLRPDIVSFFFFLSLVINNLQRSP